MDLMQTTFRGYKRENGRIGVRNHVIILPVDDLSNAAARGGREQHQGHDGDAAPLRAAAVRRRPRPALPHADRHGLQPERRRGGRDLHRGAAGRRRSPTASPPPASRWPTSASSSTATTTRSCAPRRRRKEFVQWASELHARGAPAQGPVGLDQVRRVRHHLRLRRQPDRRQRLRQALPARRDAGASARRPSSPAASTSSPRAAATTRCAKKFLFMFDRYQEVIERHKTSDLSDSQPTKGNIEGGLTTIEEKALGNIQKIGRKCMVDGVLDKAETPTGPGLWFMDSSSAAAEMVTLLRGRGLRGALLPDRPGQRDRQPDPAGDQALRQPAHGAHDERAHRRRRLGPAAARDDARTRRATSCSTACSAPPTAASPRPRRSGHREFVLTRLVRERLTRQPRVPGGACSAPAPARLYCARPSRRVRERGASSGESSMNSVLVRLARARWRRRFALLAARRAAPR